MTGDMIVKGMRVAGKTSMSPKSSESTPLRASYIITAIFPFKKKTLENKPTSVDFSGFRQMPLGSEAQCVKWRNIVAHTHHPELCIWIIHLECQKIKMLADIRPEAPMSGLTSYLLFIAKSQALQ